MKNLTEYYEHPKFEVGDEKYHLYICSGQRGRGKTTWWLNSLCLRSVVLGAGHKFVYLRRAETEMELALEKGLFNGCRTVEEFKPFWEKYISYSTKNGVISLYTEDNEKVDIGYTLTLNNIKGVSIEDADVILFDEFIAIKRSAYKGGENGIHEPELFLRLVETIFRRRNFWAVLLGNDDTPSNPYYEYWKIPFKSEMYKDKSRGLWYEYDFSEKTAEIKSATSLGLISKGTTYSDYSQGTKSLNEVSEDLICDKPAHAKQMYNIKILGNLLTVWRDENNPILYFTDKYKYNTSCTTISVTNADMSINTDFIKYSLGFLEFMRQFYGCGRVRFSNQKVATLFTTMLSIQ